ncbi:MAG: hypothetical protein HY074_12265 [Deltaproteobacteria bacterium]|nr:hypothetical protein [Deltaproteobacteria bacterium]
MLNLIYLSIFFLNTVQNAFAWGTYGHTEIAGAAVHLLAEQNHPLAKFLQRNLATVKRVAMTPDVDWKDAPLAPKGGYRNVKNKITFAEEGLHYFEVDAFLHFGGDENAVIQLPSDSYDKSVARYQALLRDNVAYVFEFDRNQSNPEAYGTAPWRILQIYDLSVSALREGASARALFLLALMTRYVGDLAGPLNTTLNFDGRHYPIPATGVYAAFEGHIFEGFANSASTSSSGVQDEAIFALGRKGMDGVIRARVIPEILRLVNSGYHYIGPLLKTFSDQCGHAHGRGLASAERENVKKAGKLKQEPLFCEPPIEQASARELIRNFSNSIVRQVIDHDPQELTVLDIAAERLGEAAALSARLWAAAYNEAGRPSVANSSVNFEDLAVRENYISPNYLTSRPTRGFGR